MKVLPNLECDTTLPDDGIEEDGDYVQLPGKNVAEAVGALLKARGYDVSPVKDAGLNGWDFEVERDRQRFWLLTTAIDLYIIQSKDQTTRFWPNPKPYRQFLSDLHEALSEDPRFSKIRWWKKNWPPKDGEAFARPFES